LKKYYGWDSLSTFMALCSIVPLSSIYTICLSIVIWILILLRTFSKNKIARAFEKQTFTAKLKQLGGKLMTKTQPNGIKYRYFTCPACKARLRVPRGKGKIKLTCNKCGNKFEKKS